MLPTLDYCCVVWQECGKLLQQRVERIQNYGMRLICSKPPRTPSESLRKELNWMPLTKRREIFRQVLIHRCFHNQAPTYLSKSFHRNEMYGPRVTRNSSKLHLASVNTGIWPKHHPVQRVTVLEQPGTGPEGTKEHKLL